MRAIRERRLTILDLILLVASLGVGFALARSHWWLMRAIWPGPGGAISLSYAWALLEPVWLVLLALSTCTVILRLLHPRERLRRLARRPGGVVMIAVVVTLTMSSGTEVFRWHRSLRFLARVEWYRLVELFFTAIASPAYYGPAVILGWTIGTSQGMRWRRADWVEWLGRGIGMAWIMAWVVDVLLKLFS